MKHENYFVYQVLLLAFDYIFPNIVKLLEILVLIKKCIIEKLLLKEWLTISFSTIDR